MSSVRVPAGNKLISGGSDEEAVMQGLLTREKSRGRRALRAKRPWELRGNEPPWNSEDREKVAAKLYFP